MPSPSTSLATLRPDLAGSLTEFDLAMDRQGFIGLRVAPVLEVAKASGTYGVIPVEELLQNRDTFRAPGSGYSRGKFTFTTASFATDEHGAEETIDDRQAALYSQYFVAEQVHTARAYDAVLRNHEKRVASLVFNTSTFTGSSLTTAVGTPWSTIASATPVTDVEAACRKVWDNSGMWPNTLIINRHVFRYLRQCTQVKDLIAASGAGFPNRPQDITTAMLSAVFDLPKIIVAGGAKASQNEGQSATFANIWSNSYAMVCYTADSQDIQAPTLARTFHWAEDGSQIGGTVETYRDESVRGDVVRVRHDTDEKIVYTQLGHLLSNIAS